MSTTLGYPSIAFVGKAGSGKSTAAQLLDEMAPLKYTKTSFADPLRKVAVELWGEEARNDRAKLQGLGVGVREIEPDTWANLWARRVATNQAATVVDDLRFENEWWTAKARGFVIVRVVSSRTERVNRLRANGKLQDESQLEHVSETSIDHLDADYTISNDGDKFDLADQLVAILDREARRR